MRGPRHRWRRREVPGPRQTLQSEERRADAKARLEQRLRDLGHGDIASILGRVASFEAKRFGLSCDLQTLRQQHSVADMDTRDELSEQVTTTSKRLQHAQSAVQEAMEGSGAGGRPRR